MVMPLRAHGVVVSHPLRMRKALGSIPSVSIGQWTSVHRSGAGPPQPSEYQHGGAAMLLASSSHAPALGGAHFYVRLFRGEQVVAGYVMWIYDT